MEGILLFIEEHQIWIYLTFALIGLIYLRLLLRSYQELSRAVFGLERERASSKLVRSAAMLIIIVAGEAATFVVATFAGPALPISIRETPIPTVSLLATPPADEVLTDEGFVTATPLSQLAAGSDGCLNPEATITSPQNGDAIEGVIQILGTANIANFAFYKIEYKRIGTDESWLTVSAGTERVCEVGCSEKEELATWDTRLVTPGPYGFRLIVTDTAGNAPLPCEIEVQVLPAP
jgi:hypothetical protein